MIAAAEEPGTATEPQRRGPRGPYAAGREAQASIVDAARAVFAEKGFRGGSLRDVGERAGVSAANVVHHFGSKERLLVAVLEARDFGSSIELGMVERYEQGEAVAALRDLVRANAQDRPLVQLFSTLAAEATELEHPAHEYFRSRYEDIRGYVTAAVEAARAHGAIPPGPEPELVAAALVAVMDGLQTQWLLDETFDMAAAFDAHLVSIGARVDAG